METDTGGAKWCVCVCVCLVCYSEATASPGKDKRLKIAQLFFLFFKVFFSLLCLLNLAATNLVGHIDSLEQTIAVCAVTFVGTCM